MVLESLRQWGSKFVWALLAVVLLSCVPLWAQQEPSANRAQQEPPANQAEESSSPAFAGTTGSIPAAIGDYYGSAPASPAGDATTDLPIRAIGSASLLDATSHLHWGDFSIGTFSYRQAFGSIVPTNGIGTGGRSNASFFSTSLMYDKKFRGSRLALQYQPRASVLNGQFTSGLLNQNLQFDTYYMLGPRWTLSVGDRLIYVKDQDLVGETLLSSDATTSTTLQNDFVRGPGAFLNESVHGSLAYAWSQRTRLSVTPTFAYSRETGKLVLNNGTLSSRIYGVQTEIAHALSARTSIGATQNVQLITSVGAFGNTFYEQYGVNMSHQVGASWWVHGSFGAASSDLGSGRQWTESATASVNKAFKLSSVALAYYRGQPISGYITNQLGERVDVTYGRSLSSRFNIMVGAGYERNISTLSRIWGKYVTGHASYRLTRSINFLGDYVLKLQRGSDALIFTGRENVASIGLEWNPRPVQ
jgi:hypothetical protein